MPNINNKTPGSEAREKTTRDNKAKWLAAFGEHWTISAACSATGVGRDTVYIWFQKDRKFLLEKKRLERNQIEFVESKLKKLILIDNLGAIIFYLKNRDRQKWGAEEKRKLEGQVKTKLSLTDDQFNGIINRIAKRIGNAGGG